MSKKLSVDDFFKKNREENYSKYIIEPIDGDDDYISLTVIGDNGKPCNCNSAIKVLKAEILSVQEIDETYICCGTTHKVVKLEFDSKIQIPIADIFSRIVNKKPKIITPTFKRHQPALRYNHPTETPEWGCEQQCYNQRIACYNSGGDAAVCEPIYDHCVLRCY